MIELHLHLDGSLTRSDITYLAALENVDLSEDDFSSLTVPKDCTSLEDYLKCFELPLKLLQTKAALKYATKSLVTRLYQNGLIYAEIRFAPLLHLQKGLTQSEVVEAVIAGLNEALINTVDFDANIILCLMRHATYEDNMETVRVAKEFLDKKVVCVDLAGAEKLHPATYYEDQFKLAKELKVPVIIHAGEATGNDEIMRALDMGAVRIGHGVHLSIDYESVRRVIDNQILFEFCPTSNLQTTSLSNYEEVPINDFLRFGIPFCINSDNTLVSSTDIYREYAHIFKTFKLPKFVFQQMLQNAVRYSFAKPEIKSRLTSLVNLRIDSFYNKIIS